MTQAAGRRFGGPYKGLDRFDEDDWRLFFGRDRERDVIVTNLRARRVTVLYGPSGVGKSSLLRAGVGHHLRRLARRNVVEVGVPEFVPVVVSDWREDPLATVRRALADAVGEFADAPPDASGQLAEIIEVLSGSVGSRLLLVLDQLEEYFLYHGPPAGADPLTAELADVLTRSQLRASFLLSIREDALAKLDPLRKRVPGLFNSVLHLEPLDRPDAEKAIVEPLSRHDGTGPRAAEPALVDALLHELSGGTPVPEQAGQGRIGSRGDRIDPSYLQMVLSTLWEREPDDRVLRRATLADLGGAESIARGHLDDALDALPTHERDLAAEALRFLVTPLGAKIALAAEELQSFTGEDVASTLEQLAGSARVLRSVSSVSGHDEPTRYEIFHDVLGPAVLDWRARYVRVRDRQELERQAEEARGRARDARRRARVFQALALAALLGLVAALVAIAVAWHEKASADRQRNAAESRAMAADAVGLLSTRLDDGVTRALDARDRSDTFDARRALFLASRATDGLVRYLRFDQRVTALTSVRDGGFAIALERGALVVVDTGGRRVGGWRDARQTLTALAQDPRRPRLAAASDDSVELLDERRGADGHVAFRPGVTLQLGDSEQSVRTMAFDDGARFLAAGGDGGLTVWRLDGEGRPAGIVLQKAVAGVSSLDFEHGAVAAIVATTTNGRLRFSVQQRGRAPKSGPPLGDPRFSDHLGPVTEVAADPAGRYVAAADDSGRAGLWSTARGGRFVRLFLGQGDAIVGLAFDRSGKRLAAASRDGTVALWAVTPPENIEGVDAAPVAGAQVAVVSRTKALDLSRLDGKRGRRVASGVESVATSENGRRLVAVGADGLMTTGQEARRVHRFAGGLHFSAAATADEGTVAAILGANPGVALYRRTSRRILQPPRAVGDATAVAVSISPDGKQVAAGYFTGAVVLWRDGRATILRRRMPPPTAFAFDRQGVLLAIGDDGGSVEIRRLSGSSPVRVVAHATTVDSLAFSPDGRLLASAGDDGVVRVWDVASGGQLDELVAHGPPATHVGFTPDGRMLVVAHGSVSSWNAGAWELGLASLRARLCSLLVEVNRPAGSACS